MYTIQEAISSFITNIRATAPGNDLHLSVLKYQSQKSIDINVKPTPMDVKDATTPLSIGVNIAPNYVGQQMVMASNPIDAVVMAAGEVTEITSQTARFILGFLGGLIVSGGKTPAGTSLSGPIGVLKTGSDVIGFAAAISVNLAVVNAFPLPALEGGQLVFVIGELLTAKKVDQRKQEELSSAALLFLLLVSAGTAVGDIASLVK
jgi:RIP metalloprotease RseP